MKSPELWRPSKYVLRAGRLEASRDPREVGVGSRLIADLVAARYQVALAQHAKGHLLDLGCGKAPLYLVYQALTTQVTCVDWANSLHPNPHLDLSCDLTQPLPFAPSRFDTVLLSDVLEHIPEPGALLGEIARVLSPGGALLLNVPFLYVLHERPHDYYRYTEFALRRFIRRAGLELVSLDAIGGSPAVLADLSAKHLQALPWPGSLVATTLQDAVRAWMRTPSGSRICARTAEHAPLGYFLVARRPGP